MTIDVYVGEMDVYQIPPDVMRIAQQMNAGKPLTDGRTRGAKYIKDWGKSQDSDRFAAEAIKKHFGLDK